MKTTGSRLTNDVFYHIIFLVLMEQFVVYNNIVCILIICSIE